MSKRTNDFTNPPREDNKRQGISATLLRPSRRSLSLVTWGGGVNHNDTGGGSLGGSSGGWNTGSLINIIGGNIGGGPIQRTTTKSTATIHHQKTTATNNIDDQLSVQTTKQDELNKYMTLMIDAAHNKSMGDLDKLRNVIKERKERIENDAITDHNTKISLLMPQIDSVDNNQIQECHSLRQRQQALSIQVREQKKLFVNEQSAHQSDKNEAVRVIRELRSNIKSLNNQIATLEHRVEEERQHADQVRVECNASHSNAMQHQETVIEKLRSTIAVLEKQLQHSDQARVECNASHSMAMQHEETVIKTLRSTIAVLEKQAVDERERVNYERERAQRLLDNAMADRDKAETYLSTLRDQSQISRDYRYE
jgi:chromosome segregation ATPase